MGGKQLVSEEEKQLYHCLRCNSVFSAPISEGKPTLCNICGKSPQQDSTYAVMDVLEQVIDSDQTHGVPGADIADFVSMQKKRRRKQAKLAIVVWCVVLGTMIGISVYLQTRERAPIGAVEHEAKRVAALRKKTGEVYAQCMIDYKQFVNSSNESERSSYVVKGVSKLLKMSEYYETSIEPTLRGESRNLGTRYYEDGEYPRLEAILQDVQGRVFELVFWNVDGSWKLDWEQHVRYQNQSLVEFLLAPRLDQSSEFKLYVRRRYGSLSGDDLNLVFYEPKVLAGVRYQESPQVIVSSDHPDYEALSEAFEELDQKASDGDFRIVGNNDGVGVLRVRANLVFRGGHDQETSLQLEGIQSFDWMEYDPVIKDVP